MHSQEIIEQYQAPEIDFQHKLLMININQTTLKSTSIYEAIRHAWKLNPEKATQADYVLAMQQGLVFVG